MFAFCDCCGHPSEDPKRPCDCCGADPLDAHPLIVFSHGDKSRRRRLGSRPGLPGPKADLKAQPPPRRT